MHELTNAEESMAERTDRTKYDLYRCAEHGLFAILKGKGNKCPYKCGREGTKYEK